MTKRIYCAHTSRVTEEWQLLSDHLHTVAERAREFAEAFGAGDLAYWAGLLRDLGKFNHGFQDRAYSKNVRRAGHVSFLINFLDSPVRKRSRNALLEGISIFICLGA